MIEIQQHGFLQKTLRTARPTYYIVSVLSGTWYEIAAFALFPGANEPRARFFHPFYAMSMETSNRTWDPRAAVGWNKWFGEPTFGEFQTKFERLTFGVVGYQTGLHLTQNIRWLYQVVRHA